MDTINVAQVGRSSATRRDGATPDLSVVILTYNEEIHIERAIRSVASIAGEVVVVDSFSTDATVEIARRLGARVLQHAFVNQAVQMQWALDAADLKSAWMMRLDADEIIEPDLARAIAMRLPGLAPEITGVVLNRKHVFMGRFIRHGDRYPMYLLRIWRRGCVRVEQRWMDEHVVLTSGRSVILEGGFADANLNDLTFFTAKHNAYATREALEVLNERFQLFRTEGAEALAGVSAQARIRRALKRMVYNRLDVLFGPLAYFFFRYVVKLGFLDGREGLIYHFLQGFWYRFLVGAKVVELERAVSGLNSRAEIVAELSRRTGHNLAMDV